MTESPLDWADDTADEPADRKRQLMVVGGVAGVAVLAGAAFLLLQGGKSSDNGGGLVANAHHPAAAAAAPAAAAPSAVPTAAVYHGAVGHDPFALPDRIAAALAAPPPQASTAKTPSQSSAGIGSVVVNTGATPGSTSASGTAQTPTQWIQLLAAHVQKDGSYNVDVRTAKGTFKGIKAGTEKIGGTFFSYIGDDSSQGPHVYEFFAGESGGSLIPNANVTKYTAGALNSQKVALSTLVYSNHQVDGGVQFS